MISEWVCLMVRGCCQKWSLVPLVLMLYQGGSIPLLFLWISWLCVFFEYPFHTGTVPQQWRKAIVTRVPKIPKPTSLGDYRPISVTPLAPGVCCFVHDLPVGLVGNSDVDDDYRDYGNCSRWYVMERPSHSVIAEVVWWLALGNAGVSLCPVATLHNTRRIRLSVNVTTHDRPLCDRLHNDYTGV